MSNFFVLRSQKHHVLLSIYEPSGFDQRFRFDLRDRRQGIGESRDHWFDETKILYRTQEPSHVTNDRVPACKPCGVTDGGRIGEFPYDVVGDQRLPMCRIGNEGLKVSL